MGNCCLKGGSRSSTMVWAADDDHWVYYSDPNLQQKEALMNHQTSNPNSASQNTTSSREVKILLSKRKLEELLGNIPVNQILDRLIDSSDQHNDHQQPWKPDLESILEEN